MVVLQFQSTPSCRGRLLDYASRMEMSLFQSTPSCRGRLKRVPVIKPSLPISIHALVQRAAKSQPPGGKCQGISIHALVQRAAPGGSYTTPRREHFNPRPRAEGGQGSNVARPDTARFQSTPSCRGRHGYNLRRVLIVISIHALVQRAACESERRPHYG